MFVFAAVTYSLFKFSNARKVSGEKSTILLLARYLYFMISEALSQLYGFNTKLRRSWLIIMY